MAASFIRAMGNLIGATANMNLGVVPADCRILIILIAIPVVACWWISEEGPNEKPTSGASEK